MASADGPWTLQRLIAWTSKHFAAKGVDAPRLTAELLLGHALGLSRLQIYMDLPRPLQPSELATFRALVSRRAAGEPTQHLLGYEDFHGRRFKVDRRALIPRPETELLVERCLKLLPGAAAARALEIGPGTGVIALTLLAERPALTVSAVELSAEAAALASENAGALGLGERFDLRAGDLFAPLRPAERFELIVANLPYVRRGDLPSLQREVRDFEPWLALDGGLDGLEVLRRFVADAPRWLQPGGWVALEIGDDQGPAVRGLLEAAGLGEVAIERDYAELDRFALARAL